MKNSILFFLTLLLLYSLTSCFEQGDNSSTNFQNKDKNEVNFNDNKIKEINKEISGLLLELTVDKTHEFACSLLILKASSNHLIKTLFLS